METKHVVSIMLELMRTDYAIMLSTVVLFQAMYLSWKNFWSLKSRMIFVWSFICAVHVIMYQYGSIRWEIFNYNQFIQIYDVNLWIIIDFTGLLASAGWLYVLDCMLNKYIIKSLECDSPEEFKGDLYVILQERAYKKIGSTSYSKNYHTITTM